MEIWKNWVFFHHYLGTFFVWNMAICYWEKFLRIKNKVKWCFCMRCDKILLRKVWEWKTKLVWKFQCSRPMFFWLITDWLFLHTFSILHTEKLLLIISYCRISYRNCTQKIWKSSKKIRVVLGHWNFTHVLSFSFWGTFCGILVSHTETAFYLWEQF